MVSVTLDIVKTVDILADDILDIVAGELNKLFGHSLPGIVRELQGLVSQLIENDDFYMDMYNQQSILGELGVPNPRQALETVVRTIAYNIRGNIIPVRKQGKVLRGGMDIVLLPADPQYLLSLPSSSYLTEKGTDIPWLDWLLTGGDQIIVSGYDVQVAVTPAQRARSRTNMALMIKGRGWRVPTQYAGVVGDNFLTRAIEISGIDKRVARLIASEFQRGL